MEIETSVARTKERCLKYSLQPLPPCYSKKQMEPSVSCDSVSFNKCIATTIESTWIICRGLCNESCCVPEWAGWISKLSTRKPEATQSVIGYMEPIFYPITDAATVQQCLAVSQEASLALGQEYTFITMDLAAAKIAYNIKWQNTERFKNVIIHLGAFHIMCSYMGCLGKLMTSSGFEDILIESQVCASGSIGQVISGKHYNRAMRVHQRMVDALERLILRKFCKSRSNALPSDD